MKRAADAVAMDSSCYPKLVLAFGVRIVSRKQIDQLLAQSVEEKETNN